MSHGFKERTIKKIIQSKITDWIDSIDNDIVKNAVKRDTIVTGGSIASMLLGEPVKDFDIYFKTFETVKLVAEYYTAKFNEKNGGIITPEVRIDETNKTCEIFIQSSGVASCSDGGKYKYFEMNDPEGSEAEDYIDEMLNTTQECKQYRPIFLSSNAITLSNKVQIVLRFHGTPEEIHKNYDFVHCTNWYTYSDHHLELNTKALSSLMSKTLYYQGSLYPLCSMFRTRKFIERGWRISAGEMLKIGFQISELDLTNIEVLREQITGVDAAYFYEILRILESNDVKDINSTYIATIIDRVFNK